MLLDGVPVGRLEKRDDGSTAFTYDPAWVVLPGASPVSLTLPLRAEPYEHPMLHPFFANLLPEGWLLELSVTKLKVSRDDLFGLLLATGRDCVGAVEVVPCDAA
ncbi:MAG: HipA N-terminal domain-containing protein [Deltaproteobacteria bacterium]|nr:HipA N-terminal domain-containing protein [Deltaproteobacteria bacterium]MBW2255015.1 HipA N-terminal domain-containing protein [Deltaproteobacteria bacterium]